MWFRCFHTSPPRVCSPYKNYPFETEVRSCQSSAQNPLMAPTTLQITWSKSQSPYSSLAGAMWSASTLPLGHPISAVPLIPPSHTRAFLLLKPWGTSCSHLVAFVLAAPSNALLQNIHRICSPSSISLNSPLARVPWSSGYCCHLCLHPWHLSFSFWAPLLFSIALSNFWRHFMYMFC